MVCGWLGMAVVAICGSYVENYSHYGSKSDDIWLNY